MNDLDLDARLGRLAATAAGDATVPGLEAIARRGRRGRRRRLAWSALLVAAVAVAVLLPVRLVGRSGPAPDDGVAPATDTNGATGFAGYWFGKVDVSVFLTDSVEPARRRAILDRIRSAGVADRVFYESRAEAYARFRVQFQRQPELLSGVDTAALPESFRVLLDDPAHVEALYRRLCPEGRGRSRPRRCIDGVDSVVDQRAVVEPALVGTFWPRTTDVTVFLVDGATAAQQAAVQTRLEATGGVRQVSYESPADALRRLRERRSAERLRLTPGSPPGSFRVALRDPNPRETAAFVDAFCHSRRTGDCVEGVAMVIAHPRR